MSFADFAPIISAYRSSGYDCISLQFGPPAADSSDLPKLPDSCDTFGALAQYVACLDEVVTVDTAMAHLAATLGVKTKILLPLASDFRWGLDSPTTPWYSTARLYRQKTIGDWTAPVREIINDIRPASAGSVA